MGIELTQHIHDLLFDRDSVVIPDLGSIISSYRAASIDHVQGLLHPPSKKLSFNDNLITNDGVLIEYISEIHQIPRIEAEKIILDFVTRTKERLDQREIIVFPNVGRLYKDYENNLQFLQDTTNFNTSVFGLPSLQYYPILRSRETVFHATQNLPVRNRSKSKRSLPLRRLAMSSLPLILGVVFIAMAYGVYRFQAQGSTNPVIAQTLPVSDDSRINRKPSVDNFSVIDGILGNKKEPIVEEEPEPEPIIETSIDTETATLAPETKVCIIIIGAFGQKSGVKKRIDEIIDLGYSVYQDKKGKLTRVGIQFGYQDETEIREKLDVMRDAFDNRAWVLK